MKYNFDKISANAFNELQVEAGLLLSDFDPSTGSFDDDDIICATTGGVNAVCTPTFSDWGEDVDNVPNNMMEFKKIDYYDCSFGFTALTLTKKLVKMGIGAADIDGTKISPRGNLKLSDFGNLWWVGDLSDGGFAAVKLFNALSTSGFSLQTGKNAKGQISVTMGGHVSMANQSLVPMDFYVAPGLTALTVVSVAGASNGKTAITVSGYTLGGSEGWVYKIDDYATPVTGGDNLSSWTDWDGTAEITATTGKIITVAAVDSGDKAVAAGSTTVTAKAST